jgi:hypothetical protein
VRNAHRSPRSTDVFAMGSATRSVVRAVVYGAAADHGDATGTVPTGADRHDVAVWHDVGRAGAHRISDVLDTGGSFEPTDVFALGSAARSVLRTPVRRTGSAVAVARCVGHVPAWSNRVAYVAVRASARSCVLDAGRSRRLGRVDADRCDAQRRRHVRTAHADVRGSDAVDADAVRTSHGKRRLPHGTERRAHVASCPVAHRLVSEPDGAGGLDAMGRHDSSMQ